MKKLSIFILIFLPFFFGGCSGGSAEEIPVRYATERSELQGNPATMIQTVIDYEDMGPGSKGITLSRSHRTYDSAGNVLTFDVEYYDGSSPDYKESFTYDSGGKMQRYDYSDEDLTYYALYTYKGGLITKAQNYYEDEPTSYYKYSYKGNKEVSRSLFNTYGVKLSQTDYTWDGDRVVKEVEQDLEEGGETVIRFIEYPDEVTEIVRFEQDGEEYYVVTVTYNEKGDFLSMHSISDGEENERLYSYEYDSVGNWVKRTVKTPEGDMLWVETREYIYHS